MAKFSGDIGFGIEQEVKPGVWKKQIVERHYYGNVIRNTRRLQTSDQLNDNVIISNQISIVADPYANENFHAIVYVTFMGTKWKASVAEVQHPRLILDMGGVYNGQ